MDRWPIPRANYGKRKDGTFSASVTAERTVVTRRIKISLMGDERSATATAIRHARRAKSVQVRVELVHI
jgi:hypothetical protein